MINGAIQSIAWTDDSQRLTAGGDGKDNFAKAIAFDTGSKVGDLNGPSKGVLTIDIKPKPFRMIISG